MIVGPLLLAARASKLFQLDSMSTIAVLAIGVPVPWVTVVSRHQKFRNLHVAKGAAICYLQYVSPTTFHLFIITQQQHLSSWKQQMQYKQFLIPMNSPVGKYTASVE